MDLGGGGLAELVGLKLGEQLNLPLRNATVLPRSNPKPGPKPKPNPAALQPEAWPEA